MSSSTYSCKMICRIIVYASFCSLLETCKEQYVQSFQIEITQRQFLIINKVKKMWYKIDTVMKSADVEC